MSHSITASVEDGVLPFGSDRALLAWLHTLTVQGRDFDREAMDEYRSAFHVSARSVAGALARLAATKFDSAPTHKLAPRLEDGSLMPPGGAYLTFRRKALHPLVVETTNGWSIGPRCLQMLGTGPELISLPIKIMRPYYPNPPLWDFAAILFENIQTGSRHTIPSGDSSWTVPWSYLDSALLQITPSTSALKKDLASCVSRLAAETSAPIMALDDGVMFGPFEPVH